MSRIERIGDATLYLGDCRDVLPVLSGVDAVVTSPPYAQQRDYGHKDDDWADLVSCLAHCPDESQVLVNLGLIHRDGEVVEYWDDLKNTMRARGWRLFGWYVWDKGFGIPAGDQNCRPMVSHEWIFHFNKTSAPINKWIRSNDRSIPGKGIRQGDGSFKRITSLETVGQKFKSPDTVIRIPPHQLRGQIENGHPAIFPIPLPKHLIKTFSNDADTILDPFMGSGTTGVACAQLGRRFIGIECHEPYFDIAVRRIEQAQRQKDLFVHAPIAPVDQRAADLFAEPTQ